MVLIPGGSFSVSLFPPRRKRGSLAEGSQVAVHVRKPFPNAFVLDIAGVHRGREVNPAKDTGRTIFSRHVRKAPELAGDARAGCAARHRETDQVCVEEPGHITVAAAAPSTVWFEG
jgi:hypothetical protein